MEGAAERMKRERAMVGLGAMLPHVKDPPTFEKFTGYEPDRRAEIQRWVAAWDKVDAALARRH